MKRVIALLVLAAVIATIAFTALPTTEAASSVISISIVDFVVYNNGCADLQAVYNGYWVVEGVPDGGTYSVTEHYSGVGGDSSWGGSVVWADSTLGTVQNYGTTYSTSSWTAPGDTPQVYFEATAGGTTVRTPTVTIDCATGTYTVGPVNGGGGNTPAPVAEPVPVPGCDLGMPISSTSVVGTFTDTTNAYWTPGELSPDVVFPAGKSAWVLGVDESGEYYQIVWSCDLLWVPVGAMGPTYDDLWDGTPLPTEVVNY